ncbi:hypothetical protein ElyMa_001875600 [Elysia marginata]|uniref:Uncharacterized protein n=1 Tax=Elysia marginata TaxID=1093978 RepID=A0AAV4EQ77_9GAST|nr:hypothetical protein ElyMa_001875600 [Elysia marginata]
MIGLKRRRLVYIAAAGARYVISRRVTLGSVHVSLVDGLPARGRHCRIAVVSMAFIGRPEVGAWAVRGRYWCSSIAGARDVICRRRRRPAGTAQRSTFKVTIAALLHSSILVQGCHCVAALRALQGIACIASTTAA